jgi:hypothetical protein
MHTITGARSGRSAAVTATVVVITAVVTFGASAALLSPAGAATRAARPVARHVGLSPARPLPPPSAAVAPRPAEPLPRPTVDGRLPDAPKRPAIHAPGAGVGVTGAHAASASPAPLIPWRVKPTPNPKTAQGDLFNVSCSKPTRCTAVGRLSTTDGQIRPLVERWNGHKWNIQQVPVPLTSYGTFLSDVACPAAQTCIAVGQWFDIDTGLAFNLAESWDGHAWTPMTTPDVVGSYFDGLYDISCTAPDACTAVGYSTDSSDTHPMVLRWDGSTWEGQQLPATPGVTGPLFEAVSCSTATDCTAVGRAYTDHTIMLAGAWDGTSWTLRTIPNSSLPSDLDNVSCTAPNACIAVGSSLDPIGLYSTPLAVAWDGTTWTVQSMPANPLGAYGSGLYGVSCRSASSCVATGYEYDATTFHPFALTWDGSAWTVQHVPEPADSRAATVYGVSCTGPAACRTVGYYYAPSYQSVTLAASGDGASWSLESSRNGVTAFGTGFYSVSCTSTTACTAVGFSGTGKPWNEAFAERWNGSRWTIQPLPAHEGFGTQLMGVSCSADDACAAVGFRKRDENGATSALVAETWDGTSWTDPPVAEPADMVSGQFTGLSCTTPDACTAVGYYFDSADSELAFAERWDGSAWTLQSVVEPGTTQNELKAVSCTSETACVAVGTFVASNADPYARTLVEVWDGTAWTVQDSPDPAGPYNTLSSVSCTSSTMCIAVGENHDPEGFVSNLAEVWDGTEWAVQITPSPSTPNFFTGVSCSTATSCSAVGHQQDAGTGQDYTFAETWNGTSWKTQTMRDWGFFLDWMQGVSCVTTRCVASGIQAGPTGIPLTLVEQRG